LRGWRVAVASSDRVRGFRNEFFVSHALREAPRRDDELGRGRVYSMILFDSELLMRRHSLLVVLALVCAVAPLGAQTKKSSAVCKDGTTSLLTASVVCGGHGGIDSVATAAAKKAAKAAKADAKAAKAKLSQNSQKAAAAAAVAKKADAKAVKAEEKAARDSVGATAQCKDGTYSHAVSGQDACARHGGVARAIKRAS